MAVTVKGRVIQMTADEDSLNAATLGHLFPAGQGPYRVRANAIHFINAAATTIFTLRVGGASGIIIYSQTVTVVNTTVPISFSEPQDLDDLTITELPTGATVVVLMA